MNAEQLKREIEKIARTIHPESTKREAVAAAKKVYKLKMKCINSVHPQDWPIGPEHCPLCSKYFCVNCESCPIKAPGGGTCCVEYDRLEDAIEKILSNEEFAKAHLTKLANKIFDIDGRRK